MRAWPGRPTGTRARPGTDRRWARARAPRRSPSRTPWAARRGGRPAGSACSVASWGELLGRGQRGQDAAPARVLGGGGGDADGVGAGAVVRRDAGGDGFGGAERADALEQLARHRVRQLGAPGTGAGALDEGAEAQRGEQLAVAGRAQIDRQLRGEL